MATIPLEMHSHWSRHICIPPEITRAAFSPATVLTTDW